MVLVDFSHLANRNLFVAIGQVKPSKVDGKYDMKQVMPFFFHLMLNSLRYISRQFKDYGKIILAIDNRNYWRRELYPEYKAHRKKAREDSAVDFDTFFTQLNSFIKILDKCFPYYVLEVDGAEADDIIAVLTKEYSKQEKVLVITSDKDMKQVLLYGAEMYDPIKQTFIKMSDEEVKLFKQLHILLGDPGDNIPNVMVGLEFSKNFIKYLKENGVFIYDPYKVKQMSFWQELVDNYNVLNKKGEKDIYKTPRFGEKTALKFLKEGHLQDYLQEEGFRANYERNKKLIDFDEIPDNVRQKILDAYKNLQLSYDGNCIFKFLTKMNLKENLQNINEFMIQA